MNWLQKNCQIVNSLEQAFQTGQNLMNPETSGRQTLDIARRFEHKIRNRVPNKNQTQGPGKRNCAACGQYLPNGGILDFEGKAGKGQEAVLCERHALQFGVSTGPIRSAPVQPLNQPVQSPSFGHPAPVSKTV